MGATVKERGGMGVGRTRVALLALTLAFAILGASGQSADASSSYRVLECNPGGQVYQAYDLNAWGYDGNVIQFGVTCNNTSADGWYKGVVFHPSTADPGPRAATAEFKAPTGTYFNTGSFRWDVGARYPGCSPSACWYAAAYVGNGGTPTYAYGMGGGPNAGYSSWHDCGTVCTRIWQDITCPSFCVHFASDPWGNGNEWYYDYVAMRDIDVTLVDTQVPSLSLSGSVFGSQIAHGTPTLQIDASDVGGGVRSASVEVNGVTVATPATDCPGIGPGAAWGTRFRPCGNLSTSVQLDTERTPWRDGANTLRVCVADVNTGPGGGNSVCEQRTVAVDNSCPDSSGAVGQADSISVGLENPRTGQLQRTRAVRSTEGTALRGHLTGGGAPVKAASICIYEAVDEPAGIEQLVQVAKSGSSGQFGVQIPGGPSRTFLVAYRYGDHQIESPSMYLDSSVFPQLKLTKQKLRNGRAVGFRGWIPGPNNDGRSVTLQAKAGKKWRSFKQLQTDSKGKFKGKYRFTQTHGRVIYVFRALVKKQGGYPYSPGASKKRKLLVHG